MIVYRDPGNIGVTGVGLFSTVFINPDIYNFIMINPGNGSSTFLEWWEFQGLSTIPFLGLRLYVSNSHQKKRCNYHIYRAVSNCVFFLN